MRAKMDGLIPFVLKALKKKRTMRHYRSLSSSHLLADVDVTEPSPLQGSFFASQGSFQMAWRPREHLHDASAPQGGKSA